MKTTLGHFMKNFPRLIALGWVNLSKNFDKASGICILAYGQERKVFGLEEDQELGTFFASEKVFGPKQIEVNKEILDVPCGC